MKPRWIFAILFLTLLALFPASDLRLASGQAAAARLDSAVVVDPVIIEEPAITPPYNSDPCTSYWLRRINDRSHYYYLTLNVNNIAGSTNSGQWQPNLPQTGIYRVEAYIPTHNPITWPCDPNPVINTDTSDARYTIQYAYGQAAVSRDQTSVGNNWLLLGDYVFNAGSAGYVRLTDLNAEENLTHTVSFSAMRFTWLSDPYTVYLPLVASEPKVTLTAAWLADRNDLDRSRYVPGEALRYYAHGVNSFRTPQPVQLTWSQTGPCASGVLRQAAVDLPSGDWTQVYTTTAPTCLGVYTYTLQMVRQVAPTLTLTATLSDTFQVVEPTPVIVSTRPAFDKCEIPSLSQLQTWWTSSPYYTINLYYGGVSRSCTNVGLTAAWVSSASQQGWNFIPTWVGPQAPCSTLAHKFSSDPATAYAQAQAEANLAAAAAAQLGLGNSVIYYDMEAYGAAAGTPCRIAVNSFISGWVARLHQLNYRAGVYGGGCSSGAADWWTLVPNVPDDAWLASWYKPYQYDPNATVWGVSCVPDTYWPDHQRLRQYNGSHNETWGGVTFNIDSNAADGEVARPLPGAAGEPTGAAVSDLQVLDSGAGWILSDERLLWRPADGRAWQDLTPARLGPLHYLAGDFISEQTGWLVGQAAKNGSLWLFATDSGGQAWRAAQLEPGAAPLEIAAASLDFLDAKHGWLALQLASGSNFSLGLLYRTQDGGQTWERLALPVGGRIHFTSPTQGWLIGGPGAATLYITQDGGLTWQPTSPAPTWLYANGDFRLLALDLEVLAPAAWPLSLASLPNGLSHLAYAGPATAWAYTSQGQCQGNKTGCFIINQLYQTTDGGQTWIEITLAE